MYELVADIEHYPDFLPWCHGAKILHQSKTMVEARLTISKGGLSKSFTTRNTMYPYHTINLHLVEGPFRHFQGSWNFMAEGEGARVSLHLEFSFDNRLIAMMFGPVFQPVAHSLLEAFVKRAESLYGRK